VEFPDYRAYVRLYTSKGIPIMSLTVSNLNVTHKQVFDRTEVTATYTLHIPPSHFANGTKDEIKQNLTCEIVFHTVSYGNIPYLSLNARLHKIAKPERFGPFSTLEERIQYVKNYVTDTVTGVSI